MPAVIGFIGGMFGFSAIPGVVGSAAYGAYMAGVGFAGTVVGGLTVKLLTSVAFSALQAALAPDSNGGGLTISTTVFGEQNPETIILGKYATGGQAICPPYSHGKSNRYLTHVIELCSAPGASLDRIMFGDEWVELGPTPHADYGRPVLGEKYEGHIWVKYYDGSQTVADPMLRSKYGAHPDRPWTEDMVGAGLCYAILTFYYDQEKLPQVPRYRFEMGGLPLYDIRQDSTAGGAGSQRLNNPSTWARSHNPVVQIWNVMRGLPLPGGDVFGGNMADPRLLPDDLWVAMMNRCDAATTVEDGTEPMYRAGIEARLDQAPATVLEELFKACSATIADQGHGWGILAGAPALPVYSFSDDDVIVSKRQELDPFPGLQDTYNAITAKFPDPSRYWETRDAPQRINAEWEAQDAFGRKSAALSLPAVPYADQVQRLMQFWIEDERRFLRHVISLPPDAAHVDLTDTISWTSVRNGYAGKAFTVHEIVEDPRTGIRQLSIRERDPSDWVLPPDYLLPGPPAPVPATIIPSEVEDFDVDEAVLYDDEGVPRRGGIRLSWAADLVADGIRWQVRRASDSVVVLQGNTQSVSAGFVDIFNGPLPDTTYEARAILIVDRPVVWSDWVSVTTPAVLLTAPDIEPGSLTRSYTLVQTSFVSVTGRATWTSCGMQRDVVFEPERLTGGYPSNPILARLQVTAAGMGLSATQLQFAIEGRSGGGAWTQVRIIETDYRPAYAEAAVSLQANTLILPADWTYDEVRIMARLSPRADLFPGGGVTALSSVVVEMSQENWG